MTTRRDFLQKLSTVGAVGVASSLMPRWMPKLAFSQPQQNPNGNVLVNIFLRGGMDGLNAVVPYFEGANYYDARPTQAIAEPGNGDHRAVDLDGRFGLHPTMRPLKDAYDAGHLGIVHATGLTDPTRSHFDAMLFMEYGTPGQKLTANGWIGRHLQSTAYRSNSPFRAVGMGALLPASLYGDVSALALKSIADFHLRGRMDELGKIQQALSGLYAVNAPAQPHEHQAKLVFDTIAQLDQLRVSDYVPSNGAVYPDDEFGLALQQVALLIKADVGLEVAAVDLGGWDTHENQGTLDGEYNRLLTLLTQGLYAFYLDIQDYLPRVMVVTMSEFGRRVAENASAGTDHGHGNFMLMMGGAVNGGQVFTDWPTLAPNALNDGDLAITTDYRDVLAELVQRHLGNDDLGFVFPDHQIRPLGLLR